MNDDLLRETLAAVAPGTELRDGLERILRGRTGALIVLGHNPVVEAISSGGFELDVAFSSTRLRELSKMDGAVVVDGIGGHIRKAAVQLLPDSAIETTESGTRHRTAERVAKQTGLPVISVSQSMHIIALYVGHKRYVLENPDTILGRANQAIATLERYKSRLDEVSGTLSALEIEDLVTVRDVCTVVQRLEMVGRISDEVATYVLELGVEGRLLALQHDYVDTGRKNLTVSKILTTLSGLNSTELLDLPLIGRVLGLPGGGDALEAAVAPHGYRLMARIPRLPGTVVDRLVTQFGGLQRLLAATIEELMAVDGVGEQRARAVREGLSRIAESSILERYV